MTIQQYFGEMRRPDSASRNRRAMIEKVWSIWITGFLQPSLPRDILLELGLTERPAMVTRGLDLYVQPPDLADPLQASGTRLVDVFDRLDRTLLILGAPGAGKTTLLLTLARDLLIRAAQDPEHPIPVIFPLPSWAQQRRPLADWLVDALHEQYDVPRKLGQTWVDADQILPLLDGLDEVAPAHRATCVEAINTFRQDHGLLPLVVCSRLAEYEALSMQLRMQGALVVQPLTPTQVESYLAQVGQPLAVVRDALHDDPTLLELLNTPLMLTIATLAYVGEAVPTQGSPTKRPQHLFAAYVDRMFQRRSAITHYPRQQAEQWLAWLAWQMGAHNQTVFYLERMQPDWLPQRQRWVPTRGARLIAGLLGWLSGGLLPGLLVGVLFGTLRDGLLMGSVGGLGIGLVGGMAGSFKEITSIETVRWSWRGFLAELLLPSGRKLGTALAFGLGAGLFMGALMGLDGGLRFGLHRGLAGGLAGGLGAGLVVGVILVFGLGAGLGIGLLIGLVNGLVAKLNSGLSAWLGADLDAGGIGLLVGLLVGLVAKLGAGVIAGLSGGEIATKTSPNEGIRRSAWMALISGLGAWLGIGLGLGLVSRLSRGQFDKVFDALLIGLLIGLVAGIQYGGRACLQHVLLRLTLRSNGAAPWRYANFLDYAAEGLFLRKVGGGYSFIHRLLQDHFAASYTDPSRAATQEPAEGASSAPS